MYVTWLFPNMLVSVRKMVSFFESKKQPRPLSLPPSVSLAVSHTPVPDQTQRENQKSKSASPNPPSHASEPHLPHSSSPAPNTRSRPAPVPYHPWPHLHPGERTRASVTLRENVRVRRIAQARVRDSWPTGKLEYYTKTGRLAVSMENKEPIISRSIPQTFSRNNPRDAATWCTAELRRSSTPRQDRLKPTLGTTTVVSTSETSTTSRTTHTVGCPSESNPCSTLESSGGSSRSASSGTSLTVGVNNGATATLALGNAVQLKSKSDAASCVNLAWSVADTAPLAGRAHTQRSGEHPRTGHVGSSSSSDQRIQSPVCLSCPNPDWISMTSGTACTRAERGGAITHKQRLRPSDSALLSLLLLFHSGTNSSMIAIDNKIEQAMDLVKSHLMLAVREEVEVLRDQIKELSERNAQLERENYILRALRDRD
ncbi:TSC22 domain family protein 1-like isoform X1 [Xyrauchen texanus]|uniref:TSC22 domain family protein 1-like isoform X1 n=1 Tax=Xyrauchen texanus TaxID=154827 RepID=UPI0022418AC3|nr:TSC22 domain family protein 1-like isoform X1 [Xyrauchen texanus]